MRSFTLKKKRKKLSTDGKNKDAIRGVRKVFVMHLLVDWFQQPDLMILVIQPTIQATVQEEQLAAQTLNLMQTQEDAW